MNSALKCVVLASTLALAACGGGGNDSPPPPPAAPSIQGFWSDDNSTTLITSNGEVWTIEATDTDYQLTRGTVNTNGGAFNGTLTSYLDPDNINASITGNFVEGRSISGTATANGQSSAFSMTYDASYSQAPSRALAAGTWAVDGGGSIAINQAGVFAATLGACALNGQLTPDSSGKNFFRLAATFGPATCALSGVVVNGVVFADDSVLVTGIVSGEMGGAFVATK